MKLYYFTFCSFMLLVSFCSCNNAGKKTTVLKNFKDVVPSMFESNVKKLTVLVDNPIKIQVVDWNKEHMLNLSTLFDTIKHVPLSNEPEAIIGNINKIVVHDSCIYVLDRYKTKSIKKFSLSGSYLATIGKQGAGPEEYIEPTDFAVCSDEIIVSDQFKSDLKYYDLSGKFKCAKKVPFYFSKFSLLSPNHYVFHQVSTGNNEHLKSIANWLIFETDSTFRITYRGFFRPKERDDILMIENSLYSCKDKVLFHPTYNDTIYSLSSDNSIRAEYIFDFPNGRLPDKYLLAKNHREATEVMNDGPYAIFNGDYVPTEDYLYFEYFTKMKLNQVVYSKKTNKAIVGYRVSNNINYIFPYANIRTSMSNNVLVGYTQSYHIGDSFERYPRSEWVKRVGEENTRIAEGIRSEDNPIILFFKIKDF